MSISDFSHFNLDPSDLPTWRKIVALGAAGLFLFLGVMITFKEIKIYETAPSAPVVATQQVYPVQVMHGYVRYVTQGEKVSFVFWKDRMGTLIAVPIVAAFIVLATYRRNKGTQASS
jgi:cytosine/uracil/thiamine/allantoin permease